MQNENIFSDADIVHSYTRAEAIADGVLVSLSSGETFEGMPQQAGIKFPVAVTAAVFADCIALTKAAERACQDERGRAWDLLFLFARAARVAGPNRSELTFRAFVSIKRVKPTLVTFRAVIGPGDDAFPVITIMYAHED